MPENVTEMEIKGTIYIIKTCCSPDARETLYDKIKRLILEDVHNLSNS